MAPRDLKNNIIVNHVMHADITDNTAQVGAVQDHRGSYSHTYVLHAGSIVDADTVFTAALTESNDNITFTAVDPTQVLGSLAFQFDSDNTVKTLGYDGYMRYTKLTITPANNTGAASFSALCIERPDWRGTFA